MDIAICHRRKFGQVWGSPDPLPEVAGNLRCQKAPLWTFDYHIKKSGFRDGTPKYVSWPNLVEISHCEVAKRSSGLPHKKNLVLHGTRPSPHFAQNLPITPKITWTVSPLDMSMYTEFGPDGLRFVRLIPERLIFWPKKYLQYRLSAYKYALH